MPYETSKDTADLGTAMLHFATGLEQFETTDAVLDALDDIALKACGLRVLLAGILPLKWSDFSSLEKGKTVFLHHSAPVGWWEEWLEMSQAYPSPGLGLAQVSLAPFTSSETMSRLSPLGIDRWPMELGLKYGVRDWLTCPVGGRWVITFWSRKALASQLPSETRAILFMGATFAAIRLQQLVPAHVGRIGKRITLTPRELAVLRLTSHGHQGSKVAALLGIGEETVRTHLKNVQTKLGVRNRAHAIAQAIRLRLIP